MRSNYFLLCVLLTVPPAAYAGGGPPLRSKSAAVQLIASVPERLSLVPAAPAYEAAGSAERVPAEQPINFTTSWNLEPTRSSVVVHAFFTDPDHALRAEGGAVALPISAIRARTPDGMLHSFAAMGNEAAAAVGGSGVEVFRQPLSPGVNDRSSRTDALGLEVNSPAEDHYDGDLTLVAQAY